MARVLLLLPARDFDPSEAAVSWRVLVGSGHVVGIAQVGRPSVKKLKPDFGRLNVLKGIKRSFGAQVWWEVAKSIVKVGPALSE